MLGYDKIDDVHILNILNESPIKIPQILDFFKMENRTVSVLLVSFN